MRLPELRMMMKHAKRIEINKAWCKGCEICVAFCPTDVLCMKKGKAVVADLDKCTACMMCELRCPDFAITVITEPETTTAT